MVAQTREILAQCCRAIDEEPGGARDQRPRPTRHAFDVLDALERGESVVVHGWEVASHLPGRQLARALWVRVEEDASVTAIATNDGTKGPAV